MTTGYQSVIELRQHLVDRLEYAVPGIAIGASKVQEIKPPADLGLETEVIGNTGPLKVSFRALQPLFTPTILSMWWLICRSFSERRLGWGAVLGQRAFL